MIPKIFIYIVRNALFKSAWTIDEAITYIKEKSGTQFDAKVTEAFLKLYDQGVIEKRILESKA
jgi:response regulator RpfG family c-di-GMP phosphodiesterase